MRQFTRTIAMATCCPKNLLTMTMEGVCPRVEYMYDANNNLIRETSYLFGQYQGYTEYTYVPVDKVVYMPIADETLQPARAFQALIALQSLEMMLQRKSPPSALGAIGTYYGWENEEELTQPVPLRSCQIWDGERITFTVYGDRIDFFGHVSKWSYENDEFRCSLETDIRNWGAVLCG